MNPQQVNLPSYSKFKNDRQPKPRVVPTTSARQLPLKYNIRELSN